MSPVDLQDRAQYLSLALFAQGVVSALMDFVDEGKDENLDSTLQEALTSLEGAESASAPLRRRAAAFSTYEQLRTLVEVWKKKDRDKARKIIGRILREPDSPKAKPAANNLIDLFSKLQDQALWNFEQPRPVSPSDLQRLCKLA
jgi:hypothetical protein